MSKTLSGAERRSRMEEIPVEGVSTLFEAISDPALLKEWVESLDPDNLDRTSQVTGNDEAHSIGSNIVHNFGWKSFPNTLRALEEVDDPAAMEPPHGILRHPGAVLDNLIHLSEIDKIRLSDEHFEGLPNARRNLFRYLVDDDTPVSPNDLSSIGGVDAAIYGSPGSGKSTLGISLVARIIEINNECVVWRGSPARTEWLPLAPWATLCLPEGIDVEATLAPPDEDGAGANFEPVEVDLADMVREVKRYRNLSDLNSNVLERGGFHVVYPDPRFRECEAVTRRASETKPLDFLSAFEVRDDEDLSAASITPTKFWWYAWLVSHVSEGPPMPVSWICDEVKALFENGVEKGDHNQPRYIRAVSDKYIDMRRNGFSFYGIGHSLNKQFSHHLRSLMRWGVTMNGKSNPVDTKALSGSAPMNHEVASSLGVGTALFWNASKEAYSEFGWSDIPRRYKVPGKLRLRYPGVEEVSERC